MSTSFDQADKKKKQIASEWEWRIQSVPNMWRLFKVYKGNYTDDQIRHIHSYPASCGFFAGIHTGNMNGIVTHGTHGWKNGTTAKQTSSNLYQSFQNTRISMSPIDHLAHSPGANIHSGADEVELFRAILKDAKNAEDVFKHWDVRNQHG